MNSKMICLKDFEDFAVEHLSKGSADFIRSGSMQEFTLNDNVQAFNRYRILPRVLRNVSAVDLSSTILGHEVGFPVGISPMGLQKLAHPEGEIGMAKGAGSMGIPYTLSTYSSTTIEDLAGDAKDTTKFYQMYIPKRNGRQIAKYFIQTAEQNGYKAVVLTVDRPVHSLRYANMRNEFRAPKHVKAEILNKVLGEGGFNDINAFICDDSVTWDNVRWLVSSTSLPVVLKGILSPADAALAAESGVAAIWVSNHGGRQLDTAPATIDVLEPIVRAVDGRCEVYLDGGVRCGTDVLKALALGANAVFIGRPAMYGLAYNGEDGVKQVLEILKNELRVALALTGCQRISDLDRSYVVHETEYKSKI